MKEGRALLVVEGVVEPKMRGGIVRHTQGRGVFGDLHERVRERLRVARKERARGVGQELALPRDGEAHERPRDRRKDGKPDADKHNDAASATVTVAAPPAKPE